MEFHKNWSIFILNIEFIIFLELQFVEKEDPKCKA